MSAESERAGRGRGRRRRRAGKEGEGKLPGLRGRGVHGTDGKMEGR